MKTFSWTLKSGVALCALSVLPVLMAGCGQTPSSTEVAEDELATGGAAANPYTPSYPTNTGGGGTGAGGTAGGGTTGGGGTGGGGNTTPPPPAQDCSSFTYVFSTYRTQVGCPASHPELRSGSGVCGGNGGKYADTSVGNGQWFVQCAQQGVEHFVVVYCCKPLPSTPTPIPTVANPVLPRLNITIRR